MKSFQDIIFSLQKYWGDYGCAMLQPYDMEVGAGTFSPNTFLRALGKDKWMAAYVQPSRRPADGRYGDNPNRVQKHHQFQVVIKPSPDNIQDIYLKSLDAVGIDYNLHDIRFIEDDWESPTLGAAGLGWEVWCDGMEITQFTYFQQVGGIACDPVTVELTYGLERLAMFLQSVDNVYDLNWNGKEGNEKITYLRPEEVNIKKGTRVRVHGGVFDGTEGHFVKLQGKRSRRVVLLIEGITAVALTEISTDFIEVLDRA